MPSSAEMTVEAAMLASGSELLWAQARECTWLHVYGLGSETPCLGERLGALVLERLRMPSARTVLDAVSVAREAFEVAYPGILGLIGHSWFPLWVRCAKPTRANTEPRR